MTTLKDMLQAVDLLPWDDVEKIQARIEQRRRKEQNIPRIYDDLQRQIDDALPGDLRPENMEDAIEALRERFAHSH